MYNQSVLCEAKRWHVHSYEEAITDLSAKDLQVTLPTGNMYQLHLRNEMLSVWMQKFDAGPVGPRGRVWKLCVLSCPLTQ